MGTGNQYTANHLKETTMFPQYGSGFELPTSEVEGECVTTAPPWPLVVCVNSSTNHTTPFITNKL